MMTLFQVGSRNYQAGTRTVGPTPKLNANYSVAQITLTRENWPNVSPLVTFSFEYSLNGTDWIEFVSATAPGGTLQGPEGVATVSRVRVELPHAGNPDRELRSVVTNAQTMRTAVTIEAE
jgi:hypothetical protein